MAKVKLHLSYFTARTEGKIKPTRETTEIVELPNKSIIMTVPAKKETIRGFTGNIYLDEFAFHQDDQGIWGAMYGAVTRGYKVRVTSTPLGKIGVYYDLWSKDNRFSKHLTDIHQAFKEGCPIPGGIEELKSGIHNLDQWAQEYECQFIDESEAYISFNLIQDCEDEDATKEVNIEPGEPRYYIGIDVGRKRDMTVIWILENIGDIYWTRGVVPLRNMTFAEQELHIDQYISSPFVVRTCIDNTGLGAQLAENMRKKHGPKVEEVTFTGKAQGTKDVMAVTLKRHFEDRKLRIPEASDIRYDIHSVKRIVTTAGNIRYDAPRTEAGHADMFWSLALAIHAGVRPKSIDFTPLPGLL
jgi:phage FluMu gp28-like protein